MWKEREVEPDWNAILKEIKEQTFCVYMFLKGKDHSLSHFQ